MPARRRAGRATSSASEPAGDGMVQAVYSYNDDNEELVNDSIAGAPSAADAAEQVSGAKVVAAERDAAERRAPGQRSEVLKAMDGENRPPNCGSGGHNHPKSPSNPLAADGAASTAGLLSAASMRLRAAELFPGGTSMPAAKPRHPPAAQKPTNELAVAAFEASKDVALIRGELAREEVVGFLVADALGMELLKAEVMRLGENARKAAIAAKDGAAKLRNGASAKKAKLRKAAGKDAARAAGLDAELQHLDVELAAALQQHWGAERSLAGLPDARSRIVDARPAPQAPMRAPVPDDICPRARALLDTSESEEVAEAVKMAFLVFLYANHNDDTYFNEHLEHAKLKYKHALRRLKRAYPEEFCGFGDHSYQNMMHWAARLEDAGHPIPAAQQAAKAFGIARHRHQEHGSAGELSKDAEAEK